jgi:hypothetical protein
MMVTLHFLADTELVSPARGFVVLSVCLCTKTAWNRSTDRMEREIDEIKRALESWKTNRLLILETVPLA